MPTIEQYNARKPIETVRRLGIRLAHSDITTQYLVNDIVDTDTLADELGIDRTWTGASMKVTRPSLGRASVSFGRVGTQAYQQIKSISGFGLMEPVELTIFEWLSGTTLPVFYAKLSIEDISISIDGVTITASEVNEATLRVAQRYTIAKFPGLEFT